MNEKNELNRIMLEAPMNRVLFRNNVGTGWVGKVVEKSQGYIVLADPRPLDAGLCKGSSDLIGWETVTITPDMVGREMAVFVAIEVKTGKVTVTEEQKNFLKQLKDSGGMAELVRTK